MSHGDNLPARTNAELPNVPRSHDATRAHDEPDQTLIYDVDEGNGAWIQGYTVNPENLR